MTAQAGDTLYSDSSLRKAALRSELRRRRAAVTPDSARKAAFAAACHLARTPWCRRAQHVAIYLDYGSELATAPLIDLLLQNGKQVYAPRIGPDQRMRFLRMDAGTPLHINAFGIAEPAGRLRERSARRMDLIVMPLLGFDARGHRLGTGGGYYDRALDFPRPFRRPLLTGYAYAEQRLDGIPAEPWDIRLDAVATELGFLKF